MAVRRRDMLKAEHQLYALVETHELLARHRYDSWLFGGWAVDFHVGSITRPHDDLDVAVWLDDYDRIAQLLEAEGWKHAPDADEDGGTGYGRHGVRLELTFVVCGDRGEVCVALRAGRVLSFDEPPRVDLSELSGTRARVLGLAELGEGSLARVTIRVRPRRIVRTSRLSLKSARQGVFR